MKLFKTSIFILFFGVFTTFSQHSISGRIIDEQNGSLPFANIVLYKIGEEATPKGTVSKDKGEFIFDKFTSGNYKLQFSMLGFKTQNIDEFILNDNKTFNITLKEESSQFLIDETIFAVYSKINATAGKWSFSGGLRYEDSNTDGTSIFMDNGALATEVLKRPIQKLFPSASISRKVTDVLGASLSYSYRIQGPLTVA
jgi:outer membrane receptor protein involved in Fe transport